VRLKIPLMNQLGKPLQKMDRYLGPSSLGLTFFMAGVAQLVRALDCGSRGRRFDPGHSPHISQTFQDFFAILRV